jgi:hypothetical protein
MLLAWVPWLKRRDVGHELNEVQDRMGFYTRNGSSVVSPKNRQSQDSPSLIDPGVLPMYRRTASPVAQYACRSSRHSPNNMGDLGDFSGAD